MQPSEIIIPEQLPIMTLSQVVLFPRAIMPLYIFEPRYREMLKDVLEGDRLFVVAGQNEEKAEECDLFEPPYEIASVGIVRASHQEEDGSSNLIVQGLKRVRVLKIMTEKPYRIVEVEAVSSEAGSSEQELEEQQAALSRLFDVHMKLGGRIPQEITTFLKDLQDPETYLDLAAYSLCSDSDEKQRLLETLNTHNRFSQFIEYFRRKNQELAIDKKLRGGLDDDQISLN